MRKKIIFMFLLVALSISIALPGQISASDTIEESNQGETYFNPETQPGEFSTMASALGTIDCNGGNNSAFCSWKITVKGDLINYSSVKVIYEKKTGLWSWDRVKTDGYSYPVNPPTGIIRNQSNVSLSPGTYRARLGGGFNTINTGPWGASGHKSANFVVY